MKHEFGGRWTSTKLDILAEYLRFFTTALKEQKFELIYIDAFAGTGRCTIKISGAERTIVGSAGIALDIDPPFSRYVFIEKKPKHVRALKELLAAHPRGLRALVEEGMAHLKLREILRTNDWRSTRGVLFLDPYGLQCDWQMLEDIAATKALDVFFLVSLPGIFRQATNDYRDADESKVEALGRFLGTDSWADDLYSQQGDIFGGTSRHRHADPYAIAKYVRQRLATIFAYVPEPVILYGEGRSGSRGAAKFALYFAVSNPSSKAVQLASKVARNIMSKLR